MKTSALEKLYDDNAIAWAEHEAPLLDKKPYDRARLDVVLGSCPPGRPILDVGCGAGQVSRYLSSRGAEVVGIDISGKLLDLARAAGGDVRYERADLETLAYEPGTVGGIVAMASLIHLDRDTLPVRIETLGRMLAPGAALLVTMYQGNDHAPFEVVFESGGDTAPATLYQRKPLEALANDTGLFDVVRVEGRRPYTFERPWHFIFVTARRAQSE